MGTVCSLALMEQERNTVEHISEQPHLLCSDRFISIWTPWDHPKITSQSLLGLELLRKDWKAHLAHKETKESL